MELLKLSPNSQKGIYAKSKEVNKENLPFAKEIATEMILWLSARNGEFVGNHAMAFAIAHCQVAENSLKIFVINSDLLKAQEKGQNKENYIFPAPAIFNAEILEAPESIEVEQLKREIKRNKDGTATVEVTKEKIKRRNLVYYPEGCMSFPFRTAKNTERYFRIKVKYQIKGFFGLKTIEEWIEGLKAHIFQHEIDHFNAKNIYFK